MKRILDNWSVLSGLEGVQKKRILPDSLQTEQDDFKSVFNTVTSPSGMIPRWSISEVFFSVLNGP